MLELSSYQSRVLLWSHPRLLRYTTSRHATLRYGTVRYGTVRYVMVRVSIPFPSFHRCQLDPCQNPFLRPL